MPSQELINEDNPYGLIPEEAPAGTRLPPALQDDPYHPDPYA